MGQVKSAPPVGGVYEQLLGRLADALDEAENLSVVARKPQESLELRNVTPEELRFIHSYLKMEKQSRARHVAEPELNPVYEPVKTYAYAPEGFASSALNRPLLACCVLCRAEFGWQPNNAVQVCTGCGALLFNSNNTR